MDPVVKLVVKAPNQQIEDQVMDVHLKWTVLDLKRHISDHYPSKPAPKDQRLIYAGHLLTDQQTLQGAFEPLNGENIHVHLVCAQKQSEGKKPDNGGAKLTSQSQTPSASASGGVAGGNSSQQSTNLPPTNQPRSNQLPINQQAMNQQANNQQASSRVSAGSTIPNVNQQMIVNPSLLVPGIFPMFAAIPGGAGGAVAPVMWTPEQMAHMQEMYTQFLAQYNLQPSTVSPTISFPVSPTIPLAFPQLFNANIQPNEPLNPPPVVPGVERVVPGVERVVPGVGGDQAPANPVRLEADDDDDENRDWLDLFYWLSRAVVLFSVVYFYSSFTRFILVVGIAILMYLHQIGFIFPANNRPTDPRQPADNRQDPDPDGNDDSHGPNDPVTDPSAPETTTSERCSGLRLFWVIVSSLFTSLIPETQAPVNFN